MNKIENTISILGCGWLGLALAEFLIKNHYFVNASVRKTEKFTSLKNLGINPYLIQLSPHININYDKSFFDSKTLIVNFPAKGRNDIIDYHSKQVLSLIKEIKQSPIENVIFISSTSVYANCNSLVKESENKIPESETGKALRIAEDLFLNEKSFKSTIIRFGGLFGYDRKAGRFFAGKKQIKGGETPVNLIHRDDCVGIINHIIKNNCWNDIYNACCPQHPKKRDFYLQAAKLEGFDLPEFINSLEQFKIISSEKLIHETGYKFNFSNPIEAL
nr:NAD(P)H-binding protein [uncultured Marinifilum sp.]